MHYQLHKTNDFNVSSSKLLQIDHDKIATYNFSIDDEETIEDKKVYVSVFAEETYPNIEIVSQSSTGIDEEEINIINNSFALKIKFLQENELSASKFKVHIRYKKKNSNKLWSEQTISDFVICPNDSLSSITLDNPPSTFNDIASADFVWSADSQSIETEILSEDNVVFENFSKKVIDEINSSDSLGCNHKIKLLTWNPNKKIKIWLNFKINHQTYEGKLLELSQFDYVNVKSEVISFNTFSKAARLIFKWESENIFPSNKNVNLSILDTNNLVFESTSTTQYTVENVDEFKEFGLNIRYVGTNSIDNDKNIDFKIKFQYQLPEINETFEKIVNMTATAADNHFVIKSNEIKIHEFTDKATAVIKWDNIVSSCPESVTLKIINGGKAVFDDGLIEKTFSPDEQEMIYPIFKFSDLVYHRTQEFELELKWLSSDNVEIIQKIQLSLIDKDENIKVVDPFFIINPESNKASAGVEILETLQINKISKITFSIDQTCGVTFDGGLTTLEINSPESNFIPFVLCSTNAQNFNMDVEIVVLEDESKTTITRHLFPTVSQIDDELTFDIYAQQERGEWRATIDKTDSGYVWSEDLGMIWNFRCIIPDAENFADGSFYYINQIDVPYSNYPDKFENKGKGITRFNVSGSSSKKIRYSEQVEVFFFIFGRKISKNFTVNLI